MEGTESKDWQPEGTESKDWQLEGTESKDWQLAIDAEVGSLVDFGSWDIADIPWGC